MNHRLYIARTLLFVFAITIMAGPLLAQQNYPPNNQQNPQNNSQQTTPPSQEPSKQDNQPGVDKYSTSPSSQSPDYSQSRGDIPPADYGVTRADSRFAWGTLISGLVIGIVLGYLIGNAGRPSRPSATTDIPTDRAA
jgi:hypothetical protein